MCTGSKVIAKIPCVTSFFIAFYWKKTLIFQILLSRSDEWDKNRSNTYTHTKIFYLFFSIAITCNLFAFTCIFSFALHKKRWMSNKKGLSLCECMNHSFFSSSSFPDILGYTHALAHHEWINSANVNPKVLRRKKNSIQHQYLISRLPPSIDMYRLMYECTSELIKI